MTPTSNHRDPVLMIVTPQSGGVTDYAHAVAAGMRAQRGGAVQVLPMAPDLPLDGARVVLHYSGYGYARRGAPVQLLRWLTRTRPRMHRFGIFFHELYAFGPPTSSAFWFSPLQRLVAARLAQRSDFWLTNLEQSEQWLLRHAPLPARARLAICSTVGDGAPAHGAREPIAVVFGSPELRELSWRAAGPAIFDWARAQGVQLHDAGAPLTDAAMAETLRQQGVVAHGRLPTTELQGLLRRASFGLTRYPPRFVAKSSVFGAYCAFGLAPILFSDTHGEWDGLRAGVHYLHGLPTQALDAGAIARIGRSAWDWYQDHCVDAHARVSADLLAGA